MKEQYNLKGRINSIVKAQDYSIVAVVVSFFLVLFLSL